MMESPTSSSVSGSGTTSSTNSRVLSSDKFMSEFWVSGLVFLLFVSDKTSAGGIFEILLSLAENDLCTFAFFAGLFLFSESLKLFEWSDSDSLEHATVGAGWDIFGELISILFGSLVIEDSVGVSALSFLGNVAS